MNINKINALSFGATVCDVPGRTARETIDGLYNIQQRERKAGYGYGRCPVPGRDDSYAVQTKLDLMSAKPKKQKLTINVADKNDEVIQAHLDAIAQRNKALLSMMRDED